MMVLKERERERERERDSKLHVSTSVIGMNCFSIGVGLSRVTEISEDESSFETTDTAGERGLGYWLFEVKIFSEVEGKSSSPDSSSESLLNKASVASSLLVNVCFRSNALCR